MAKVLRVWSPFNPMDYFGREIERAFNRMTGRRGNVEIDPLKMPPIESFFDRDRFVVRVDLPGIDAKELDVSAVGNRLILRGSRIRKNDDDQRKFLHREISYGHFERSVTLPKGLGTDEIEATYRDGVLELSMPISRDPATRIVPIKIAERE